MTYKNIFVTVGTTRFDKLCETILMPETIRAFRSMGCVKMTVQMGNNQENYASTSYDGLEFDIYRFKDSIIDDMKGADLVISHAGAGSCLEVLDCRKPLLVVINTDLMDNHQIEIAEQLQNDGHLYYCTCDTLRQTLCDATFDSLKPYKSADSKPLFDYLDTFLRFTK